MSQIHKHGITANSYRLRGKILKNAYDCNKEHPLSLIPGLRNTFSLDCHDNVGNIAEYIFASQFPSYQEKTTCGNGCEGDLREFACYEVLKSDLITKSMEEIVRDWRKIGTQGVCSRPNCSANRVDTQILGELIIFNHCSVVISSCQFHFCHTCA